VLIGAAFVATACGNEGTPPAATSTQRAVDPMKRVEAPDVLAATPTAPAVDPPAAPPSANAGDPWLGVADLPEMPAGDPLTVLFREPAEAPEVTASGPMGLHTLDDLLAAARFASLDARIDAGQWPNSTALPFSHLVGGKAPPPLQVSDLGQLPAPFAALRGVNAATTRATLDGLRQVPSDPRRTADVGVDTGRRDVGATVEFNADDSLFAVTYVMRLADASVVRRAWGPGRRGDGGKVTRWTNPAGWSAELREYAEPGLAELWLFPSGTLAAIVGDGPDGLRWRETLLGRPVEKVVAQLRKEGADVTPVDDALAEADDAIPPVDHQVTVGATEYCSDESLLTLHTDRGVVTELWVELCFADDEARGELFRRLVELWGPASAMVDDDGDLTPGFVRRGRRILAYGDGQWLLEISAVRP
jgi:hypothetical protein